MLILTLSFTPLAFFDLSMLQDASTSYNINLEGCFNTSVSREQYTILNIISIDWVKKICSIIIWLLMGTSLLLYIKKRLHIPLARWIYYLDFAKLYLLFFAIIFLFNLINLCAGTLLEFLTNHTVLGHGDPIILYSSDANPIKTIGGTDGTITDSSSKNSPSTSNSTSTSTSPSTNTSDTQTYTHTHTHTHTGTGVRSASAAQEAGNYAIMAGALAALFQIAKSYPTIQGKIGAVAGSIIAGGTAIATKHITSNISGDIGKSDPTSGHKNFFMSSPYEDADTHLMLWFNFTNDNLANLLKLIAFCHQMQWVFATIIGYYAVLLYIPIEKLETVYERFLPKRLSAILIKSVRALKKSGVVLVVIFYILLLVNLYLADYNLDMIMKNYEYLCQYHVRISKQ